MTAFKELLRVTKPKNRYRNPFSVQLYHTFQSSLTYSLASASLSSKLSISLEMVSSSEMWKSRQILIKALIPCSHPCSRPSLRPSVSPYSLASLR